MSEKNIAFLHQWLAIVTGAKQRANSEGASMKNELSKDGLFRGLAKTYTPKNEDGEKFPPERVRVQRNTKDMIEKLTELFTDLFNFGLTIDRGNMKAMADIVVDDVVIVENVPVTTLLFLEHQMEELKGWAQQIPVLDEAKDWEWDESNTQYKTESFQTGKTKKVEEYPIIVQATDKHPAQVAKVVNDVVVGYWTNLEFSGAMRASEKAAIQDRCVKLARAIKFAREKANSLPCEKQEMGGAIMSYLFKG